MEECIMYTREWRIWRIIKIIPNQFDEGLLIPILSQRPVKNYFFLVCLFVYVGGEFKYLF